MIRLFTLDNASNVTNGQPLAWELISAKAFAEAVATHLGEPL